MSAYRFTRCAYFQRNWPKSSECMLRKQVSASASSASASVQCRAFQRRRTGRESI